MLENAKTEKGRNSYENYSIFVKLFGWPDSLPK